MNRTLFSTNLIAQAYSCDTYGESAYGTCPTTSTLPAANTTSTSENGQNPVNTNPTNTPQNTVQQTVAKNQYNIQPSNLRTVFFGGSVLLIGICSAALIVYLIRSFSQKGGVN